MSQFLQGIKVGEMKVDIKAKHRIIGIIVLIALAVIFIPLFFTHSDSKETRLSSHVPNPPTKPGVELTIPTVDSASVPTAATPPQPVNAPANSSSLQDQPTTQPVAQQTTADSTSASLAAAPEVAADDSIAAEEQVAPQPTSDNATPASSTEPAAPATMDAAPMVKPAVEPVKATEPVHRTPKSKTGYTKAKYAATHHKIKHVKTAVVGKAWTIQLGSFSEKANAQKLVKQLRNKGFAAYLNTAKTSHGNIVRVFVGPELKQDKAQQLVTKLHQEFGLKGVVVKYEV